MVSSIMFWNCRDDRPRDAQRFIFPLVLEHIQRQNGLAGQAGGVQIAGMFLFLVICAFSSPNTRVLSKSPNRPQRKPEKPHDMSIELNTSRRETTLSCPVLLYICLEVFKVDCPMRLLSGLKQPVDNAHLPPNGPRKLFCLYVHHILMRHKLVGVRNRSHRYLSSPDACCK